MTSKKILGITVVTNLALILILAVILSWAGQAVADVPSHPEHGGCGTAIAAEFEAKIAQIAYNNNGQRLRSFTTGGTFYARIELPDGETVTEFLMGSIDKNTTKAITATLYWVELATGIRTELGELSSDGSSSAFEVDTVDIDDFTVDNATYAYGVEVTFGHTDGLWFYWAEVSCGIV